MPKRHREDGAVRHTNSALQIFRPPSPPLVLPRELRRYAVQGAKLQPLKRAKMAGLSSHPSVESPLFLARSTGCLDLCHPKRSAPNREEWLLQAEKTRNCGAATNQLSPMQGGLLQLDYAQSS